MEAKREHFRKYLERCGVIDALSKALIKLYEEPNKPDDAVRYVRKYMCESCPDDAEVQNIKADLEEATKTLTKMEVDFDRLKGELKRTPSDVDLLLTEGVKGLAADDTCNSLLKKHLNEDLLERLKPEKTAANATLLDCTIAGFKCHEHNVGVFAADSECYELFKDFFMPLVTELHEQPAQKSLDWGNVTQLKNLDPDNNYVNYIKMTCFRNLEDYPFFPKLTEAQFLEIEGKVQPVAEAMEGEHKGTYYQLATIDADTKNKLKAAKLLFDKPKCERDVAGATRFWPTGRGVFHSDDKNFIIWVNPEEHLQITSITLNGDLCEVYRRLAAGVRLLEETLKFLKGGFGYLTADPARLGSTLSIIMEIKLVNMAKATETLKALVDSMGLTVRELEADSTFEIATKCKIGPTEFDIAKKFQEDILKIIKTEEEAS